MMVTRSPPDRKPMSFEEVCWPAIPVLPGNAGTWGSCQDRAGSGPQAPARQTISETRLHVLDSHYRAESRVSIASLLCVLQIAVLSRGDPWGSGSVSSVCRAGSGTGDSGAAWPKGQHFARFDFRLGIGG